MKLEIGDEVDQYRIVRQLGQGGMGAVYKVEHVKLGVRYALKTFTLEDGHAALFDITAAWMVNRRPRLTTATAGSS